MSRVLNKAVDASKTPADVPAADRRPPRFGWRRLQMLATLGVLGSLLIPMLVQLDFESFILAMAVPFIIGLLLMLRWPGVGVIWLGVVSLAELLFSAPFLADALTHPESMADFVPLSVFAICTVVGTVAALPSFRERTALTAFSRRAGAIGLAAGALIVGCAAISVVAFAKVDNMPAQRGDIRVVAQDLEFRPTAIDADGTTISLHVTNKDSTRHTFTIDELGIDLNVPANSTQRVAFKAEPGTYRFFCRPHEGNMRGLLRVRSTKSK